MSTEVYAVAVTHGNERSPKSFSVQMANGLNVVVLSVGQIELQAIIYRPVGDTVLQAFV